METDPYTALPMSPIRKMIAARMTEAKQTIPHYRLVRDIELDALLAARQQLNLAKDWSSSAIEKLSINDLLIKATALALREIPALNCQLVGEEIHQYHQADIAVITAIEGGVTLPIIRAACSKSVVAIAEDIKSLSERARLGQLKMREISGGTFGLSNLGMYGVEQFDAIINPPQCAMLAVGTAKQQTVVKDGEITIATVLRVALSLDHRAIDGAQGAEFLGVLKRLIENPEEWLDHAN